MELSEPKNNRGELYFRLIAFWAVCEAFAGGIMHAVKMPFTGLAISSLAVLSIILIGCYCRHRMAILKATVLVCIFKFMLSPHSPPTAYLAVAFQGLMGQLLFLRRFSRAGAITLGVIALVESSVQRILVMVILYGVTFWDAVNAYIKKTVGSDGTLNYLYMLALGYIFIHFITGLLVGNYAFKLARLSSAGRQQFPRYIIPETDLTGEWGKQKKTGIKFRILAWAGFLFLLFFYLQSKFDPANSILPAGKVMNILIRTLVILLAWYVVISPLLMALLTRLLEKGRRRYHEEISRINTLLPRIRLIFQKSVLLSREASGLQRMKLFFLILVLNITRD